MADSKQQHNVSDVWQRLELQSGKINDIATGQAATDARLDNLERTLEDGIRRLTNSIEGLNNTVHKPTNWFGLTSAAVGVITAMVGFVYLVVSPLNIRDQEFLVSLATVTTELNSRNYKFGELDKGSEWHQKWLEVIESQIDIERARNADIEERVSRMEGRQEMIKERQNDIDNAGSRRWNRGVTHND